MQTQYYCYRCSINTSDFPVVNVQVDELSSARIWQHKLCATLSANVNINYRLPIKGIDGASVTIILCLHVLTARRILLILDYFQRI
jgi:hypothetical protein